MNVLSSLYLLACVVWCVLVCVCVCVCLSVCVSLCKGATVRIYATQIHSLEKHDRDVIEIVLHIIFNNVI